MNDVTGEERFVAPGEKEIACQGCRAGGTVVSPAFTTWLKERDVDIQRWAAAHPGADLESVPLAVFAPEVGTMPASEIRCPVCRGAGVAVTADRWTPVLGQTLITALARALLPSPPHRRVPWPWLTRQDGAYLHGIYVKPAPDDALGGSGQLDFAAFHAGMPVWKWRGPAMPRSSVYFVFRSAIRGWTPILAQRLSRCWLGGMVSVPGPAIDHDEWTREAVLAKWKPMGYFDVDRAEVAKLRVQAERANVTVTFYGTRLSRKVCTYAGSNETFERIYGRDVLDGLIEDYREVLPAQLAAEQAEAIQALRARPPAAFASREEFETLERWPLAAMGLVLGYPAEATAGTLLAQPYRYGASAELGSLPVNWRRGLW
ncbi:hypothetical protein OHA25_61030 (plasmid) [Nonomuraea sp. NBC_00507]|uniref:hypothetical protein n=1 Tax=Nonomuraea sp. NBC_00507 TaxID=2976002 RepID=UPI002E16EFD7